MDMTLVEKLVLEAVRSCAVDLYHLEWIGGGRRNILRVFIDKAGGVSVGDCENVSRELGVLLDAEDAIAVRYNLEVSSPGLDRRLYTPDHYRSCLNQEIDVRLGRRAAEGRHHWVGVLEQADGAGFLLRTADEGPKRFRYEDVDTARLRIHI